MKITLIGAGRLGKQIYLALISNSNLEINQWFDRSSKKQTTAEGIKMISNLNNLKKADIYLLAISDSSILEVSKKLPSEAFVVHTAGGVSLDIIKQKRAGIFYPIQTFSEKRKIDFSEIFICLQSKNLEDLLLLKKLCNYIGAKPFEINSKQIEIIHLSAVLVNNFTNHLFVEALNLCKRNKLPFKLLKPLIQETFKKLDDLNPIKSQTGPAIRKDNITINKHLKLIQKPQLKKIYKTLTLAIQNKNESKKL